MGIFDFIQRKLRALRAVMVRARDGVVFEGHVKLFVHDALTGELLETRENHNIVTDEGLRTLCDILAEATSDKLLYVAAGTGTTAATAADTALETEVWRDAIVTKVRSGTTLVVSAFMDTGEANGNDLSEFGILTASSGGRLFNHVLLSPVVSKDATKTVTIQITISASR